TTILLVEQNARLALSIADYAYIMENGRIVLEGDPAALRDNADVREFYLGLTDVGQRKSYREIKHYKRRKRWLS
ncbi:MAG: ABC transporter ATP-binding protein, partial [Anaerolineae bacterium]